MKILTNRRKFLGIVASTLAWFLPPALAQNNEPDRPRRRGPGGGRRRSADDYVLPSELAAFGLLSLVLGRASDRSVTVSALAKEPMEGYFEYGTASGNYMAARPTCSRFPPANRWSWSSTTFSPTPNTSTGCNVASRAKPISTRGRSAAFTRNVPPAAPSRLPFKAIRTRNVPR